MLHRMLLSGWRNLNLFLLHGITHLESVIPLRFTGLSDTVKQLLPKAESSHPRLGTESSET